MLSLTDIFINIRNLHLPPWGKAGMGVLVWQKGRERLKVGRKAGMGVLVWQKGRERLKVGRKTGMGVLVWQKGRERL